MNKTMTRRHRGCLWWLSRLFVGIFILILALVTVGFTYETITSRNDLDQYPPPGKLVDVGGHKMHLYCTGESNEEQPTVVLDAAGGLASADWALVQPDVAEFVRVCSYDRAGYGWSDSGPLPRTSQQIATELHTLLLNAGEKAPFVLVGHSFGGHTVRLLADQHIEAVESLILIDTRPETMLDTPALKGLGDGSGSNKFILFSLLSRLGVTRMLGAALLPPDFQERLPDYPAVISYRAKYFDANRDEANVIAESDAQLKEVGSLESLPLIVIQHGIPDIFVHLPAEEAKQAEKAWQESQEEMGSLSTNNQSIVAENSGHFIPIDQPEIVIEAIRQIMGALEQSN